MMETSDKKTQLVPPHGGLSEPVDRTVPEEEVEAFREEAAELPAIGLSAGDVSTAYRIADGTLSPLRGPMTGEVYDRVLEERVLESRGRQYAWTIPIAFPVTHEEAQRLEPGRRVALRDPQGGLVGTLAISDIYPWDKEKYLHRVYQTERTDHPGGDMVLGAQAEKTHLLGGELRALPQPKKAAFSEHILRPREIRSLLAEQGWDAAVAFQTRNPLHRAHEYALVYALEELLRRGYNAGAVLNPLLGETKGDDVSAEIRMETYEALIRDRALGDGDSDATLWAKLGQSVPDRVLLIGLDMKMFYAGPNEAVMHAIYRQNMGFSHIVIGRKHADAPFHDGSSIWGDFDAQAIFEELAGELHIEPVKVGFAAFYESLGRVDLIANHPEEQPVFISGKQVRAMLKRGELVDPRIMRESTSRILARAMREA